jgi:hypothetical protein
LREIIPVLEECLSRSGQKTVTGDENLWTFSHYHHGKQSIDPDDQDCVSSRAVEHRKARLTPIWPPGRFPFVNLLPERMIMNTAHFIEHISRPLAQVLYPEASSGWPKDLGDRAAHNSQVTVTETE